ncbi:MAG: HAD family hydrolase, partial [Lachnospiraceae bacterium]|nr:HAD family hydrolase [Lachnospiraceae bacterium]
IDSAVKELNERFFSEYVSVAIGERPGVSRKPAPDTVFAALAELGSSPDEAVYIGDSEVDLMTAKNSNLPCIAVLWGFRDKEFLIKNGASAFAKTPKDIISYLTA